MILTGILGILDVQSVDGAFWIYCDLGGAVSVRASAKGADIHARKEYSRTIRCAD